jgi:hypothetical protein
MMIGAGVMVVGAFGLYLDEKKEGNQPATPLQKELDELKQYVPKITVVDRREK